MSRFQSDLHQEAILSAYLDNIYELKGFDYKRVGDLSRQHQGIDVEMTHKNATYCIDEKAQLHYLNKDLPTFTFELSYLKDNTRRQGWLFDEHKATHYYFLVTGIMLKTGKDTLTHKEDIQRLKITSVNRAALINHLTTINLTTEKLSEYDQNFRCNNQFGKQPIPELDASNEGCLYFTKHLSEKPINVQLRLNYLIAKGVAKRIYE